MTNSHSTDEFADGPFKPHGRLEIQQDGDVVIYDAVGPFNLEMVVASAKFRAARATELPARYASIHVFQNSMLMSPDALAAYADMMLHWPTEIRRPVATAHVISPDMEGRYIMLPHFIRIFAQVGFPWQHFETLEPAQAWARAQLAAR